MHSANVPSSTGESPRSGEATFESCPGTRSTASTEAISFLRAAQRRFQWVPTGCHPAPLLRLRTARRGIVGRFRRCFGLLGLASNLGVGGSNPSLTGVPVISRSYDPQSVRLTSQLRWVACGAPTSCWRVRMTQPVLRSPAATPPIVNWRAASRRSVALPSRQRRRSSSCR